MPNKFSAIDTYMIELVNSECRKVLFDKTMGRSRVVSEVSGNLSEF